MRRCLSVAALIWAAALADLAGAEPGVLRITAYINIASGCQTPTEQCLKDLAAKYRDRLALEFVDFGTPAGRERWTADGRHCLVIALNGSSKADIVYRGAKLTVTFEMPAGHNWLHEELETAVRQKLDGVSPADLTGPEIAVRATPEPAAVLVAGQPVIEVATAAAAESLAATLRSAAAEKPLLQDDFTLDVVDGSARVSLRGTPILDLGQVGAPTPAGADQRTQKTLMRLIQPFPRLSRPFPGSTATPMRR